jgi:hypothetical protein
MLSRSAVVRVVPTVVQADSCCHYQVPVQIEITGHPFYCCVLATSSHRFKTHQIVQDAALPSHTGKLISQFGQSLSLSLKVPC